MGEKSPPLNNVTFQSFLWQMKVLLKNKDHNETLCNGGNLLIFLYMQWAVP